MKILHVIEGKANPNRANGVNQVIYGLAKYQSRAGHKVRVFGMSKGLKETHEVVDWDGFSVDVYKELNFDSWIALKQMIAETDVVHLHSVWKNYNVRIGKYLKSIDKPYIITAHCGLSEDRIRQSNYLVKMVYHKLFQKELFDNASAVHALTREESTDILKYCDNRICVVNNGVDFETYSKYKYAVKQRDKIVLGYLGRLSVEKNLDNLIRSITLLPDNIKKHVELRIIGPENADSHIFKDIVAESHLEDSVKFMGGKYGEDKIKELLDVDAYIHPAYSDVVGISVMEALALGIPTIVTRTSHMSYFNTSHAFIMIEPTAMDMARGIEEFANCPEKWSVMSDNAKKLAATTFNWEVVVAKILDVYKSVIK